MGIKEKKSELLHSTRCMLGLKVTRISRPYFPKQVSSKLLGLSKKGCRRAVANLIELWSKLLLGDY